METVRRKETEFVCVWASEYAWKKESGNGARPDHIESNNAQYTKWKLEKVVFLLSKLPFNKLTEN